MGVVPDEGVYHLDKGSLYGMWHTLCFRQELSHSSSKHLRYMPFRIEGRVSSTPAFQS